MSTSFSGLTNAASALAAQQYAMGIAGQNIANANTAGYTRLRANFAEQTAVAGVPRAWSTIAQSGVGTVTSTGATRLNDPVLDARSWTEHGRDSAASTTHTSLSSVESLFDEPSSNGLSEQLSNFWSTFNTLAGTLGGSQGSNSAKSAVISAASGVATTLNALSQSMANVATTTRTQLTDTVSQINAAASSLAGVNNQIALASATGQDINALSDQRDQLVLSLSKLGGVATTIEPNGTAAVTMGGQSLVSVNAAFSASTANPLVLTTTASASPSDVLSIGGSAVGPAGGVAQSLTAMLNTTLPAYTAQLDGVASAVASTVNGALTAGYTDTGVAGISLFTPSSGPVTAATISVAFTNPNLLATTTTVGGGAGNEIPIALAASARVTGSADDQYGQLVTGIGSAVASASLASSIQSAVTGNVDAQQASTSGVNYDEETTALMAYQRAYQASARVLTTVDEMLDTLINGTGRVGR
jgi:flagellar hook-associated protein 1 FlgK